MPDSVTSTDRCHQFFPPTTHHAVDWFQNTYCCKHCQARRAYIQPYVPCRTIPRTKYSTARSGSSGARHSVVPHEIDPATDVDKPSHAATTTPLHTAVISHSACLGPPRGNVIMNTGLICLIVSCLVVSSHLRAIGRHVHSPCMHVRSRRALGPAWPMLPDAALEWDRGVVLGVWC